MQNAHHRLPPGRDGVSQGRLRQHGGLPAARARLDCRAAGSGEDPPSSPESMIFRDFLWKSIIFHDFSMKTNDFFQDFAIEINAFS